MNCLYSREDVDERHKVYDTHMHPFEITIYCCAPNGRCIGSAPSGPSILAIGD